MTLEEFRASVTKIRGKRNSTIPNAYRLRSAFLYYRKIRPKESKYVLTETEYYKIIRLVNNILKEKLINGEEVEFPERMGKLELRKKKAIIDFSEGYLKTNLVVDWNKTLELWYEDEESYKKKKLVRIEEDEIFCVFYNRLKATYNNNTYYRFRPTKEIKVGLKNKIKNNEIDALMLY